MDNNLKYLYPYNLLTKLGIDQQPDNINALSEIIDMFLDDIQKQILLGKYKELLTYRKIAKNTGISEYKVTTIGNKALYIISTKANMIKNPKLFDWYKKIHKTYDIYMTNPNSTTKYNLDLCRKQFPIKELMISDLSLPTNISNALHRAKFRYVADMLMEFEERLKALAHLGDKSIEIINLELKPYGYKIRRLPVING